MEGCANPLHVTDQLPRFVSRFIEDKFFGAEHDVLSLNLAGTYAFVNPPFSGKVEVEGGRVHFISALLRRWAVWVRGSAPTRCVFVIPEPQSVGGLEFIEEARALGGWVFLSSEVGSFPFWPPDGFRYEQPHSPGPTVAGFT